MNARVMDHEQAIKKMMAERYLLGELSDNERDAYEEHLFSCPECFEQVRAGTEFVSYLKRIGVEEPAPQPRWRQFLTQSLRPTPAFAFAACVLAAIGVYQNMSTIQRLKAPEIESRYMLTEPSRGNAETFNVSRSSRIGLATEFRLEEKFVSYETQIVSDDGEIKLVVPFSIPASRDIIEVSLYAGTLKPGGYSMLVQGTERNGSKQELARRPFRIQFLD
jgi:hypothetical protein